MDFPYHSEIMKKIKFMSVKCHFFPLIHFSPGLLFAELIVPVPISTVLGPNISLIPTELLKKNINSLESKMFPLLSKLTASVSCTEVKPSNVLDLKTSSAEPSKSDSLSYIENLSKTGAVMSAGTTGDKKSAVSGCTSSLYDSVNKLSNTSTYEPRKYKCPNCSITYKYKQAFKEHLLYDCKAAFTKPMFVCPYCQKIGQKQFLREHIIQEHLM